MRLAVLTWLLAFVVSLPVVEALAESRKYEGERPRGHAQATPGPQTGRVEERRPGLSIPPLYSPRQMRNRLPPGHLPPRGKCRIWYPDLPPGHQPPPGSCRELLRQVPAGAFLVEG